MDSRASLVKNLGIFAGVAALWVVLDQISKVWFSANYALGQVASQDYVLFTFHLVHNKGAAWGIFSDSTFALGVLSCVVCTAVVVALVFFEKAMLRKPVLMEVVALALVFGGGIGNAIDRFALGYVVDFIEFTFIDFPVFNIADIGVTCGFILFFVAMMVAERRSIKETE